MRHSLTVLAAATLLAACGKKDSAEESRTGASMSAEAISGNDVTAIDAVTGEAANMAADVEMNAEMANSLENAAASEVASGKAGKPAPTKKKEPTPTAAGQAAPAEAPATNTTN
jgi:hypothetical protein